jgi:hypothetical protein
MLRMRARTYALRDEFTDVLKGLTSHEEAQDLAFEEGTTTIDVETVPPVNPHMPTPKAAVAAAPEYESEPSLAEALAFRTAKEHARRISAVEFVDTLSPAHETAAAADAPPAEPGPPPVPSPADAAAAAAPSEETALRELAGTVAIPTISENQRKALFAEMKKVGKSVDDLKTYLAEEHEIGSSKAIPLVLYDTVKAWCGRPKTAAAGGGQQSMLG